MANATDFQKISSQIRMTLDEMSEGGGQRFAIYPFGELGMLAKRILKEQFDLEPAYVIDEVLSKYHQEIQPASFLKELTAPDKKDILVLLVAGDPELRGKLKANVLRFLPESRLIDPMAGEGIWDPSNWVPTQCGRHSYGALCNHPLVARVGNFCSFAAGADVVNNHQVDLLSTSPFLVGRGFDRAEGFRQVPYEEFHAEKWYVPGIHPRGTVRGFRRITIGHDVWLGKNVTITNYSDIGNGVIAGAGAVITKPVPDFAIVVGVPAHIVCYRYTKEQIKALNKIQWWNWSDEEIRERFEDMYLPIDNFIEKYL